MAEKKQIWALKIPPSMLAVVKEVARRRRMTAGEVVRRAIESYLKKDLTGGRNEGNADEQSRR